MYTIGKLVKKTSVNVDTIRFYERQRLIAAATKTASGYRLYTDESARRITFIKRAQRCGFGLAEIRQLLEMNAGDEHLLQAGYDLAAAKQAEIDETRTALAQMSEALSLLLSMRSQAHAPAAAEGDNAERVTPLDILLSAGSEAPDTSGKDRCIEGGTRPVSTPDRPRG